MGQRPDASQPGPTGQGRRPNVGRQGPTARSIMRRWVNGTHKTAVPARYESGFQPSIACRVAVRGPLAPLVWGGPLALNSGHLSKMGHRAPQVGDKLFSHAVAVGFFGRAENCRGVIGGHQGRCPGAFEQFAAAGGDAEFWAEQRLSGGGAEADDQLRLNDGDLGFEPRPAGDDFRSGRVLVQATLAALFEFEMLDGVGHVDFAAVEARGGKRFVEQASGRPDERPPLQIFLIARHLADEDDLGISRSFAEDGLRGVLEEVAALAMSGRVAKRFEIEVRRQKVGG